MSWLVPTTRTLDQNLNIEEEHDAAWKEWVHNHAIEEIENEKWERNDIDPIEVGENGKWGTWVF